LPPSFPSSLSSPFASQHRYIPFAHIAFTVRYPSTLEHPFFYRRNTTKEKN
jgi:hypothetical protein